MDHVSPAYRPVHHLRPLTLMLEDVALNANTGVQACITTPPRHAKTETFLHSIGLVLAHQPHWRIGYVTYAGSLAEEKGALARDYAAAMGHVITRRSARAWRTIEGGGMDSAGVDGQWTGKGYNLLIVDDPFKNRAEAESALQRQKVWEFITDSLYTRRNPGGASLFINMARWHVDDVIGRIEKNLPDDFDMIRLAAICDDPANDPLGRAMGAPLWGQLWPVAELEKIQRIIGPYGWASLYQGQPKPRGGRVFDHDPVTYEELPTDYIQFVMGLDLAYTAKSTSDFSVVLVLARVRMPHWPGPRWYLVDLKRDQCKAPVFRDYYRMMRQKYPHAPGGRWYCAGPEVGVADLVATDPVSRQTDLPIEALPATSDKFIRSQPVAAAWNRGEILVPASAPWLDDFLTEVLNFTGVNDVTDDQVDALAAAFDQVNSGDPGVPTGGHKDRPLRRFARGGSRGR